MKGYTHTHTHSYYAARVLSPQIDRSLPLLGRQLQPLYRICVVARIRLRSLRGIGRINLIYKYLRPEFNFKMPPKLHQNGFLMKSNTSLVVESFVSQIY